MNTIQPKFESTLSEFLGLSDDGYAVFSADDRLVYCNNKYAELWDLHPQKDLYIHWDDVLRNNFRLGRGINVSSGDIEEFIKYTHKVRRSRTYRLFEVDFMDGRWFLFSEQMNEKGEIFMQMKDLTKQKLVEESLTKSLTDLQHQAMTDELTKVGNRRALVESVSKELERCRRSGASMSMLLFDLDYFKKVNDVYGHQAGDAALKHVAKILKDALRQYDILGRIGGEEFAVFLSNTKTDEASHIAERMRSSVALADFNYQKQKIGLSVSVGLTTRGCSTTFEELYKESDYALYNAKSKGRNCVRVFEQCAGHTL